VIIGKLIPAGTGMPTYREIATDAPDYEPLPFYTSEDEDLDLATWLRDQASASASSPDMAILQGGISTLLLEGSEDESSDASDAGEGAVGT
jgi:hypothetical protein